MATAKRLMTSSAWETLQVGAEDQVGLLVNQRLNRRADAGSRRGRDVNHLVVTSCLTLNFKPWAAASASVSPTSASGGWANTVVGTMLKLTGGVVAFEQVAGFHRRQRQAGVSGVADGVHLGTGRFLQVFVDSNALGAVGNAVSLQG